MNKIIFVYLLIIFSFMSPKTWACRLDLVKAQVQTGFVVLPSGIRAYYIRNIIPGTNRPTVALVHGITRSSLYFEKLVPAILARGYSVFRIDLHNIGQTLGASRTLSEVTLQEDGRLILQVAETLGVPKPMLVGHSRGAGAALHALALSPDYFSNFYFAITPFVKWLPDVRREELIGEFKDILSNLPRVASTLRQLGEEETVQVIEETMRDWCHSSSHLPEQVSGLLRAQFGAVEAFNEVCLRAFWDPVTGLMATAAIPPFSVDPFPRQTVQALLLKRPAEEWIPGLSFEREVEGALGIYRPLTHQTILPLAEKLSASRHIDSTILHSTDDPLSPPYVVDKLGLALGTLEENQILIEGGGHYLPTTHIELVAKQIDRAIRRVYPLNP